MCSCVLDLLYLSIAAITCTSLSPISNGMISYSRGTTNPFDFGTIATFVCDDGFFLDGSMTSTCGGTAPVGLWDESSPICSGTINGDSKRHLLALYYTIKALFIINMPVSNLVVNFYSYFVSNFVEPCQWIHRIF